MKPTRGKTPRRTPKRPPRSAPKDPVEVYCRLRPLEEHETEKCCEPKSPQTIRLWPPQSSAAYKSGNYKEQEYTFKFLLDERTSQKAVFDHVALPLVDDLLHCKNGLLFTYGITGSGKTYTMTGTPQDGGILPRTLDVIFNSISELQARKYVLKPDHANMFDVQTEADAMLERQQKDIATNHIPKVPTTPRRGKGVDFEYGQRVPDQTRVTGLDDDFVYSVFISYCEIYNNYIYDLLEEMPSDAIKQRPPTSKVMREDENRNMYVSGAVEVEVKNTDEAFDVLLRGQKKRRMAHTVLNTESSRSHSVFNIRLATAPLDPQGEEVLQDREMISISQLSLVDLAGSERTYRTNNAGARLREAGNINNSLMTLRTCIEILRENQKNNTDQMVPYRDSKLTHLFKNYFDGEGKVKMIVCVNPGASNYEETVHVMKFAELTQEVVITRPMDHRFDVGFTPGRRRANQMYKEAIKKAESEGSDEALRLLPIPLTYSLGPPFPTLEITDASDESVLLPLVQFLVDRQNRRNTLLRDLAHKQTQFRNDLINLENERNSLRDQVEFLQAELEAERQKTDRLQKTLKQYEKRNTELQGANLRYEQDRAMLQNELEEKDMKISQEAFAKDRLKHKYMHKIENVKEKQQKELEKVRMTEAQLTNKMWEKEEKLRIVKEILETDTPGPSARRPAPVQVRAHRAPVQPAKSESRLNLVGTRIKEINSRTAREGVNRVPRSQSPPPRRNVPVVNVRSRHRRSRSVGDRWLDHKPLGNLELDTVFQQRRLRKKSVSKLNKKDTKDVNKYVLTHQEQKSDGEIETKLVKGDVHRTRSGGTAVVFDDIEVLRQVSPTATSRKRSAEQCQRDPINGVDGDWTDVETRCSKAIEGTGAKRSRN